MLESAVAHELVSKTTEASRTLPDVTPSSDFSVRQSIEMLVDPTVEIAADELLAGQFCRVLGMPETEKERFRKALEPLRDFSGADVVQKRRELFATILTPYFNNPSLLALAVLRFEKSLSICVKTADETPRHIAHVLGKGGSAFVYLGVDPSDSLSKPYAFKQSLFPVKSTLSATKGEFEPADNRRETISAIERCSREIQFSEKGMRHGLHSIIPEHYGHSICENIAGNDGQFYPVIQQEVLKGATMQDLIASKTDGETPVSAAAFYDMAKILFTEIDLLHDRAGLIHRDLKPGNIHIGANGRIKLLDLGLALEFQNISPTQHTRPDVSREGAGMGTPLYAAPEQFQTGKVGRHADVYSLLTTLYKLATGTDVFAAKNEAMIAQAHYEPARVTAALDNLRRHGFPHDIVSLFERGWNIDPSVRPEASELIQAFGKYASVGAGQTLGQFKESVLDGKALMQLDEDVLERVTSEKAPYPHGFESLTEMSQLYLSYTPPGGHLQEPVTLDHMTLPAEQKEMNAPSTPQTIQSHTRSRVGTVLLGSAAVVAIAAATIATVRSSSHSVDDRAVSPSQPIVKPSLPSQPEVSSVPKTAEELAAEEAFFPSSPLFHRTVAKLRKGGIEEFQLKKLVMFPATPAEVAIDSTKMTTYTSGGKVRMVQFAMTIDQLLAYASVSLQDLPEAARGMKAFPVFLILNPATGEFVFTPHSTGWVDGMLDGTIVNVHTDLPSSAGIQSRFGANAKVGAEATYAESPFMLNVLESLPTQYDETHPNQQVYIDVINSWRDNCRNTQKK